MFHAGLITLTLFLNLVTNDWQAKLKNAKQKTLSYTLSFVSWGLVPEL
jgi:hypothetical protein